MVEQIDLFSASVCDYEEENKVKEQQRQVALRIEKLKQEREDFLTKNLTPRQHRLVDFLEDNFQNGKYFTIEEIVYCVRDKEDNPYYKLNTNPKIHDKCATLSSDIRAINWAIGNRYSIIVKDKKGSAKLCESQKEFDDWKDEEKAKIDKKYQYLNNLVYKSSFHDTMVLINLNDRALNEDEYEFVDVYKGEN